ncbi:hypothetical protein BGZ76_007126 [Entomortierella beljakovae]|nr:hypothetical protein BGZ76_007126 [Entomortierella beljakovae]
MTRFRGQPDGDYKTFNRKISSIRTKIEHAFGMFKGRWRCLTKLAVDITTEEDLADTSMLISACVVLHNILTKPEIFDDDEMVMYIPPNPEDGRDGNGRADIAGNLQFDYHLEQVDNEEEEEDIVYEAVDALSPA